MNEIFPVILSVPPEAKGMKGRLQKEFLSGFARQAVRRSAGKRGLLFEDLRNDTNGCPIPEDGRYWSLSHKPLYVAGVAATRPVGIDVEPIRPVDERWLSRIADATERRMAREDPDRFFFRLWTAKEAVVKAIGGQYPDIFRCRVAEIADEHRLVVLFEDRRLSIEHHFFDSHIASLVTGGEVVSWQLEAE